MNDKETVEWQEPREMLIPRPTVWPLATSFAITFLLLGLITNYWVIAFGFVFFVISIVGWMGEILHDGQAEESHG